MYIIFPYPLFTHMVWIINSVNIEKITNLYDLLNRFNDLIDVNRDKRGSHKCSYVINYINLKVWLKYLEDKFISAYNIKFVKAEMFKLKIETL